MKKNKNISGRPLRLAVYGHKHALMSREGGIEVVVGELVTRMAKKGIQVTCYDRKSKHVSGADLETPKNIKGIKIVPVWTINRRGLAALTSSYAAAIKAAFSDADVVHIHGEGPGATCWIPRIFGKKIVLTCHGLDWQRAKWGGFASKYIKFGEREAVKWADEIIVLSHGVQEYFKKEYGRETVFIPNGVSKPEVKEADEIKKQWNLEKDSYVLFLGRIVPEKGLRYLVEAWRSVLTDKKLVITGGRSDTAAFMDELKEIAAGDDRVIFTGFQQGRVLEELYSNAYVYCLPSDLEGMPLSLLEAMSYGNCCVVSDIPECTEVVEDKAVVFKKSDVQDLKRVLQELMDNEQSVIEYKNKVADFITAKYNWDDVVDRTLELYKAK